MNAPTELAELNAAIDAQVEIVSDLIDPYLDLQAEHLGEVARYGDSWPGAASQISRAGAALRAAQELLWDLLDTRNALYPFVGPIYTADDEEQF